MLELLHHLGKALRADVVAGGERVGVALGVDRQAGVGADHRHQRLVDGALIDQLEHRNVETFHEHVGRVGPKADAADVHQVAGAGEQRDKLALPVEGGRRDHEVVEMAGAHPRVVGDVGVARLHGLEREVADEMLHRLRHRVDVTRRAGDGLRQHSSLAVEDAGREVAALAHDRRERGAHQHLRLLLHHRDQAVPHDLQVDECGGVGHGCVSRAARSVAPSPGGGGSARVARRGGATPRLRRCLITLGSVSRLP